MLPDNDQSLYGNGMAVNPMFSQGAKSGNASPPMSYEDGGAIPDDEEEYGDDSTGALDAAEPDETTKAVSNALKTVNSVLMYGRQKHGLPTDEEGGDKETSFEDGGAIPDDEEFNDAAPEGGAEPVFDREAAPEGGAEPTFNRDAAPEGGAIPEEDMSAVTAPTDDASLNKPQDMAPVLPSEQPKKQQTPLQYLMGTDAIDPQTGDRVMKMAGNDAAKAIDLMVNGETGEGGYGPGWAMAQYLRRKYDLYMNHGRAAVDNDDYQNAANSIMKAFENLPDGQKVSARPEQDGVRLTAIDADGKPTASAMLNRRQLDTLTNTGKAGQFDAVLAKGAGPTINALLSQVRAAGNPAPVAGQPQRNPDGSAIQRPQDPDADRSITLGHDVTELRASPQYRKAFPGNYEAGAKESVPGNVRMLSGPNSREDAADKEDPKLAAIKERNSGALERAKLNEENKNRRAQQVGERQVARDKAISERREKSGNSSAERAQRALEYRVAGERLKLKREGYKDEDIEKMIASAYGGARQATPPAAAPAAPQAPQPRQPSPQDQAAINWARSNPNDPRAQQILRLNGVQ